MSAAEFWAAVRAGNTGRACEFARADPSLLLAHDGQDLSPVMIATYHGHRGTALALIDLGAPLSAYEAAATGQEARLHAALDAQPQALNEPSPDGFGPLALAAYLGHLGVVRALLARGADVLAFSSGRLVVTPLHAAAAGNHTGAARELLVAGADPNAVQPGGFTALMSAAMNGNTELAGVLLAHGANPALASDDGQTAGDHARLHGHEELALLLNTK